VKDFTPYSNLWLTADKWFKHHQSWLNDEWESLDAVEAEKFVEEAVKTLAGCVRYFRDTKK
jgi:dynein heavy chain